MLRFVDALKSLSHNRARRQRLGKRVAVVSDFNQQRAGGNMLVKAPVLDLDLAAKSGRNPIDFTASRTILTNSESEDMLSHLKFLPPENMALLQEEKRMDTGILSPPVTSRKPRTYPD